MKFLYLLRRSWHLTGIVLLPGTMHKDLMRIVLEYNSIKYINLKRGVMKFIYIFINLILALSLLAWPMALIGGVFLTSSHGEAGNFIRLVLGLSILIYPLPVLIGLLGFWRNKKECDLIICKKYTLIGLIGPISILLFFIVFAYTNGWFDRNKPEEHNVTTPIAYLSSHLRLV